MDSLQRRCAAAGVELRWQAEVNGYSTSGSRITSLQVDSEEIAADEFILCAGVWTSAIGRELGLRLPMQAGKGYSLTLTNPARSPKSCALLTEARVAVSPMDGKLRFGGTMELAGIDESINPIRVRGIIDAAKRYYPQFTDQDFAGIEPWRGLRERHRFRRAERGDAGDEGLAFHHPGERLEDGDFLVERERRRLAERAERDDAVDAVVELPRSVLREKSVVDRHVRLERRGDRRDDALPLHGPPRCQWYRSGESSARSFVGGTPSIASAASLAVICPRLMPCIAWPAATTRFCALAVRPT
jgi:hypothetical protein